jgi:hypothetical protein
MARKRPRLKVKNSPTFACEVIKRRFATDQLL